MPSNRNTSRLAAVATALALANLPGCASAPSPESKPEQALVRVGVPTDTAYREAFQDSQTLRSMIARAKQAGLPIRGLGEIAVQVDDGAKAAFAAYEQATAYGRSVHPPFRTGSASDIALESAQKDRRGTLEVTNIAMRVGTNTDGSISILLYNPLQVDQGLPSVYSGLRMETGGALVPPAAAFSQLSEQLNLVVVGARSSFEQDLRSIQHSSTQQK